MAYVAMNHLAYLNAISFFLNGVCRHELQLNALETPNFLNGVCRHELNYNSGKFNSLVSKWRMSPMNYL